MYGRHQRIIMYVIFGLIAVGILSRLFHSPQGFIIPIAVFGIVFLLYKFPPKRYRRGSSSVRSQRNPADKSKPRTKGKRNNPFRVIEGHKGKDDDTDPPPYH